MQGSFLTQPHRGWEDAESTPGWTPLPATLREELPAGLTWPQGSRCLPGSPAAGAGRQPQPSRLCRAHRQKGAGAQSLRAPWGRPTSNRSTFRERRSIHRCKETIWCRRHTKDPN